MRWEELHKWKWYIESAYSLSLHLSFSVFPSFYFSFYSSLLFGGDWSYLEPSPTHLLNILIKGNIHIHGETSPSLYHTKSKVKDNEKRICMDL